MYSWKRALFGLIRGLNRAFVCIKNICLDRGNLIKDEFKVMLQLTIRLWPLAKSKKHWAK